MDLYYVSGTDRRNLVAEAVEKLPDGTSRTRHVAIVVDMTITNSLVSACGIYDALRVEGSIQHE